MSVLSSSSSLPSVIHLLRVSSPNMSTKLSKCYRNIYLHWCVKSHVSVLSCSSTSLSIRPSVRLLIAKPFGLALVRCIFSGPLLHLVILPCSVVIALAYYSLFSHSPHFERALDSYMRHPASKDMLEEVDKAFMLPEAVTEEGGTSKLFSLVWRTCVRPTCSLAFSCGHVY